jgi:hypothetical protein
MIHPTKHFGTGQAFLLDSKSPVRPALMIVLALTVLRPVMAAQRTWIGGDNTWTDGGSTVFWNPADEPDADDEAIFNTANLVLLGSDNLLLGLSLSGGIDLDANGFRPLVTSQTTVDGAGTTLRLRPRSAAPETSSFITADMDINNTAQVTLIGGILDVGSLLEINSGTLEGRGTVVAGDADANVETVLENSSRIAVTSGVLTLTARGVDRLDLDGTSETGILDVANVSVLSGTDIQTLIINGPLADAFSGTLQVGQRDTVDFNDPFAMSGADLQFDGGLFVATMSGAAATIVATSVAIRNDVVFENNLTFSGTANVITLDPGASLRLSGTVGIADASALSRAAGSTLIIAGTTTIQEAGGDFRMDTAPITVVESGRLTLAVDQIDIGNNTFNGLLNLNDHGDLAIQVAATSWSMDGTLIKNNVGVSTVSGDAINVHGAIIVNAGTLELPNTALSPGASITTNGVLSLDAGAILAGPASVRGLGTLQIEGDSFVSANTTIDTHTFDWDGSSLSSATILDGVVLTINSVNFDSDGNTSDLVFLGGNGAQLLVNGSTEWSAINPITLNTAASGVATIGGTSRLFIRNRADVDGDTTISAPLTLASSSAPVEIDAGKMLNANNDTVYISGTMKGAGRYNPGPTNTVNGDTTISPTNFDFDAGVWTINEGAELIVNVTDYDAGGGVNAFDSTMTIHGGRLNMNSSDARFVMDGVFNMISTNSNAAEWVGQPVDIGNDTGTSDADLNVSGVQITKISAPTTIKSDADIHIAAGSVLQFNNVVGFDTVNGTNRAHITGDGRLEFLFDMNVREAVTLNMVGGSVDLEAGQSFIQNEVDILAPLIINAAMLESFGTPTGLGVADTLLVDSLSAGAVGSLTVNIEEPTNAWTLNQAGVLDLRNDNAVQALLAGSDVIVNGLLKVTGNVSTTARLEMGATGTVRLSGANDKLHMSGGNLLDAPNTITGATITGTGELLIADQKSLIGFGTINTTVHGVGFSELRADNGTLTINGSILATPAPTGSFFELGTNDIDGILHIPADWNLGTSLGIELRGGTLQGGTITNDSNIQGSGLVTSRVINNARILSLAFNAAPLVVQSSGNDNDWDGAAGNGLLQAGRGSTLELRDNSEVVFTGRVSVGEQGRVFANGFSFRFDPASSLFLNGTFESSADISVGGDVVVGEHGGIMKSGIAHSILFEQGSLTTLLDGDLRLVSPNARIEEGAAFAGSHALMITAGSGGTVDPDANVNALLINALVG